MNYALVTIDTEAWHGDRPIDRFVWGEVSNGRYGIEYMIDLFDRLNVKALFFVDFAECSDYGNEEMLAVARYISTHGHSVGVHLHPDHIMDKKREFLYQYNKDEQRELIRYVTEKYKEALGEVPVHFRAGKYAANNDTLELLSEFGYKYDYSQFYGRDWCAIDPPITADSACRYGSFYEIPVTSFYALDTPLLSRVDKVDMEMSPRSFRRAVKKFNSLSDNQILTLFGHSFSFIKHRYSEDMDKLSFDSSMATRFERCIKYVQGLSDISIVSPDQLEKLFLDKVFDNNVPNDKPSVIFKNPIDIIHYFFATAWRIKSFNRKARALLLAPFCVVLILCLLAIGIRMLG